MKNCLYKKCNKEFTEKKPKQVFCSAKCRVYFSREKKKSIILVEKEKVVIIKKSIIAKSNMPIRMKGEDFLDFAARKNEWKLNNQ